MQTRVFIVVPAFNEARRLGAVLDDLCRAGQSVVVVDDGSRDRTAEIAGRHGCYVLRHAFNRGQGAALQTGITFALREGADVIVTFDADGQHQTADLPALIEPIASGRCDVVLGNRFMNGQSNVPPFRAAVLQLGRLFTRMTSGLSVGDCHNGYRAFSRRGATMIALKQDRMAHASEIYDQIKRARLAYEEVPVTIRYTAETLAKGQKLSNSVSVLFHYLYGKIAQ
jgi:glycosyltransferase involved in cell wall biosynthesis